MFPERICCRDLTVATEDPTQNHAVWTVGRTSRLSQSIMNTEANVHCKLDFGLHLEVPKKRNLIQDALELSLVSRAKRILHAILLVQHKSKCGRPCTSTKRKGGILPWHHAMPIETQFRPHSEVPRKRNLKQDAIELSLVRAAKTHSSCHPRSCITSPNGTASARSTPEATVHMNIHI